jgi:hypothetical protein
LAVSNFEIVISLKRIDGITREVSLHEISKDSLVLSHILNIVFPLIMGYDISSPEHNIRLHLSIDELSHSCQDI